MLEVSVKQLLSGHTLVLSRGDAIEISDERGVKPLLARVGRSYAGYTAADRVVGRAAAFLYALLGVERVYAEVVSAPAAEVLARYKIACVAETVVPRIRNRRGDGFCPMETAVEGCMTAEEALVCIRRRAAELAAAPNP